MKTKMFKRIISIALCLAMLAAMGSMAVATEREPGRMQVVEGNDFLSVQEYTVDTEYQGIVATVDGHFAMEVETDSGIAHVPVGMLEIDLANRSDIAAVLEMSELGEEIREEIARRQQLMIDGYIEPFEMTVFSPALLDNHNSDARSARVPLVITETTFNGVQMRNEQLHSTGMSTGWQRVASGTSAWPVASSLFNIAIVGAGFAPPPIALAAAGLSLGQVFVNRFGPVTASSTDYIEVRVMYNDVMQWTYRNVGGVWTLGLVSQRVNVTNVRHDQYFWTNATRRGQLHEGGGPVNLTYRTPNFDSPWAVAFQNAGWSVQIEDLFVRIHNRTFRF